MWCLVISKLLAEAGCNSLPVFFESHTVIACVAFIGLHCKIGFGKGYTISIETRFPDGLNG